MRFKIRVYYSPPKFTYMLPGWYWQVRADQPLALLLPGQYDGPFATLPEAMNDARQVIDRERKLLYHTAFCATY